MNQAKYNRQRQGAIAVIKPHSKLSAIADLSEAIRLLTVEDRIHDTDEFGVDLGKVLCNLAGALSSLGVEVEANVGGFGKAPTLTVAVHNTEGVE